MAPLPQQIPFAEGGVDEVRLEGTFNADLTDAARGRFIAEAFRVLRPGGKIVVHGLVSDRPFPGVPALPGPAAMVRHIPVATAVLDELAAGGFAGLFYERLGDIHCFQAGGVELREMRLIGVKPFDEKSAESNDGGTEYFVLYRGPLAQVNEENRVFPRGKRVRVDAATWRLFREAPFAEQFTCFVPSRAKLVLRSARLHRRVLETLCGPQENAAIEHETAPFGLRSRGDRLLVKTCGVEGATLCPEIDNASCRPRFGG